MRRSSEVSGACWDGMAGGTGWDGMAGGAGAGPGPLLAKRSHEQARFAPMVQVAPALSVSGARAPLGGLVSF
jgi:hypothetical protein